MAFCAVGKSLSLGASGSQREQDPARNLRGWWTRPRDLSGMIWWTRRRVAQGGCGWDSPSGQMTSPCQRETVVSTQMDELVALDGKRHLDRLFKEERRTVKSRAVKGRHRGRRGWKEDRVIGVLFERLATGIVRIIAMPCPEPIPFHRPQRSR